MRQNQLQPHRKQLPWLVWHMIFCTNIRLPATGSSFLYDFSIHTCTHMLYWNVTTWHYSSELYVDHASTSKATNQWEKMGFQNTPPSLLGIQTNWCHYHHTWVAVKLRWNAAIEMPVWVSGGSACLNISNEISLTSLSQTVNSNYRTCKLKILVLKWMPVSHQASAKLF